MHAKKKSKVLLSSITRPIGPKCGDAFLCRSTSFFQRMWPQDIFRFEDNMWHWGLDIIAANIESPTVVLQYPTLNEFTKELKNHYDYIGISFNNTTFHKMVKMVEAIRRHSPDSKIILGGYGTALPDETLKGLGDYICREEGLAFMRKLLKQKEDKPFVMPHIFTVTKLFSLPLAKTGIAFSSIGCPNLCNFCVTSHMCKGEKIYFHKNIQDFFKALIDFKKSTPSLGAFFICDEDFIQDKQRTMQFHALVKKTNEYLNLKIFTSIQSLSQYDPIILAEMGITNIWIGLEDPKIIFSKQKGRGLKELIDSMGFYGISVTSSLMLGFDHQTKENVRKNFENYLASNPVQTQITIITPIQRTPFWKFLNQQGRILESMRNDYKNHDGTHLLFKHPHISSEEMVELYYELMKKEYEQLGPTFFRLIYCAFQGYKNLKNSDNVLLKKRADSFFENIKGILPYYKIGILLAPNERIKKQLLKQEKEIIEELGKATRFSQFLGYLLLPAILWTKIRFKFEIFMQPALVKKTYN